MTKRIKLGSLYIGGDCPISIQSMTNTESSDIPATVKQIKELVLAGCDIVRLSIPDERTAYGLKEIKSKVREFSNIPLIADIHFDYRLALLAISQGADKIRINPGNIGREEYVLAVVDACKKKDIPIRIGVNSGSLSKRLLEKHGGPTAEALVESAMEYVKWMENQSFYNLVLSVKSSDVQKTFDAYRILSDKTDYPLHIGLTEAGTLQMGQVKSAAAMGGLLLMNIGDTLRVSLTEDPVKEVDFAKKLLLATGKRRGLRFISCPTCGRTKVDLKKISQEVEKALYGLNIEGINLTVAVMGCGVNGPGEAREADFGVACGDGKGLLFAKGEIVKTVKEENITQELLELIKKSLK